MNGGANKTAAERASSWMSNKDTTMRVRRQLQSNQNGQRDAESFPEHHGAAPVARIFNPSDLDLDDLAEAIRSLLGSGSIPQTTSQPTSPGGPNPALLSFPRRVTHVVETTETQ